MNVFFIGKKIDNKMWKISLKENKQCQYSWLKIEQTMIILSIYNKVNHI